MVMGSCFVAGLGGVADAPIERHHGFDVAAKIGWQASGFAEQIVELHFGDGRCALYEITFLSFQILLLGQDSSV